MYPEADWDCAIFVYKPLRDETFLQGHCKVIHNYGGKYADHLNYLKPEFLLKQKYQLVVIHIEDVIYDDMNRKIDWGNIYEIMVENNIDSLSPLIRGSQYPRMVTNPAGRPDQLSVNRSVFLNSSDGTYGYNPQFIETFIQVFQGRSWPCFWDMMNGTAVNHEGWGFDICYRSICNPNLYLIKDWIAIHTQADGRVAGNDARSQMDSWLDQRKFRSSIDPFVTECRH